jgi:dTDP-4-amino-4,6-dideoxygalactose transaminase
MNKKIYLSLAHMGGREQDFIKEAFDTNWIVPLGPNVDGFERDLADFLGNDSCVVALSAGTAAIHLGLILLGIQPGDEVLCQSFTFSASANPIAYLGAEPVFVDSEQDTWNMSPVLLEDAIKDRMAKGKKPKAIIVVHLYGMPAKMKELLAVADKFEIPLLEDAAEALGSEYCGQRCGTFGQIAAISFNGNKIITTSGGGAFISHCEDDAAYVRFLATQARDNMPHYQHSHIGYNYRLSNVSAGIGRGQMLVLNDHIQHRRDNNAFYRKALAGFKGITFQTEPDVRFHSNYWLTSIIIDPRYCGGATREDVRLALDTAEIEARPLWKPLHLQPVFAHCPFYGTDKVSERLFADGLCLPSGSSLSITDLQKVVDVIASTLSR